MIPGSWARPEIADAGVYGNYLEKAVSLMKLAAISIGQTRPRKVRVQQKASEGTQMNPRGFQ